nr:50S ribosomal protein L5 [Cavernulicola chilensis]
MTIRLKHYYEDVIFYELFQKLNLHSFSQVPKITKCVITLTSSKILDNPISLSASLITLDWIIGQRSKVTNAQESLSALKIQEQMEMGSQTTLRGDEMYLFLDYVFLCLLPKLFGLSEISSYNKFGGFDSEANFSFGIPDVFLFPHLQNQSENLNKASGFSGGANITLVFSSNRYEYNKLLLSSFQWPL